MSKLVQQATNAHGAKLMELMRAHMQLMQEQMQSMPAMMGGGGAMGGSGMMGGNAQSDQSGANCLAQMQTRMDLMQHMIKQMVGQQQMVTLTLPNAE